MTLNRIKQLMMMNNDHFLMTGNFIIHNKYFIYFGLSGINVVHLPCSSTYCSFY